MIQSFALAVAVVAAASVPLTASPAFAKTETKAMLSKSCSVEKVRQLSGGAAVRVVPGATTTILNVTLDTTRMSWVDLTKKMHAAGCFN